MFQEKAFGSVRRTREKRQQGSLTYDHHTCEVMELMFSLHPHVLLLYPRLAAFEDGTMNGCHMLSLIDVEQ